jgi:hypothetical protein
MSKDATEFAIEVSRKILGAESSYRAIALGSLHEIEYVCEINLDWQGRGIGHNVNFMFDYVNSGTWDLILNCCCEHMYPMYEIKLPATYILQSNNRYGDDHINRVRSMEEFLNQTRLDEIIYANNSSYYGVEYYTVIGEKW